MQRIVAEHAHTLALKRRQRLVPDEYGILDPRAWEAEVHRFISQVAYPNLRAMVDAAQYRRSVLRLRRHVLGRYPRTCDENIVPLVLWAIIHDEIDRLDAQSGGRADGHAGFASPAEFEEWVAAELHSAGWAAAVTGQSGDQGVDVRATRAGLVLVVQCKLYRQPVGNDAVQQVYAGMAFYRAGAAAVVSSAGFTPAARALAAQTGVRLLLPSEVQTWARRLVGHSPDGPGPTR